MLRALSVVFDDSPACGVPLTDYIAAAGVCSTVKNVVTFVLCLSWQPWLQNSANGGDNLAGVGGDSNYGRAGGEPALRATVSGDCCLPVIGSPHVCRKLE